MINFTEIEKKYCKELLNVKIEILEYCLYDSFRFEISISYKSQLCII